MNLDELKEKDRSSFAVGDTFYIPGLDESFIVSEVSINGVYAITEFMDLEKQIPDKEEFFYFSDIVSEEIYKSPLYQAMQEKSI